MTRLLYFCAAIVPLLVWGPSLAAQGVPSHAPPSSALEGTPLGFAQGEAPEDSTARGAADTGAVAPEPHSPSYAMTLSAILPGAGQVYNRAYWKVPIIAGLGGYFVYGFFQNQNDYKRYRDAYDLSQEVNPPNGNDRLRQLRDFYKGQRDSFGWYFIILYLVNIADAYVDASLFSFDVGDDLAFREGARPLPLLAGVTRLNLRFHF
jgi:hypothetical protein